MILYHGSGIAVEQPDVFHSRKNVDFGPGFYTTPLYEQAYKWAERFYRRSGRAYVSKYELDEEALRLNKVLRFETYSDE